MPVGSLSLLAVWLQCIFMLVIQGKDFIQLPSRKPILLFTKTSKLYSLFPHTFFAAVIVKVWGKGARAPARESRCHTERDGSSGRKEVTSSLPAPSVTSAQWATTWHLTALLALAHPPCPLAQMLCKVSAQPSCQASHEGSEREAMCCTVLHVSQPAVRWRVKWRGGGGRCSVLDTAGRAQHPKELARRTTSREVKQRMRGKNNKSLGFHRTVHLLKTVFLLKAYIGSLIHVKALQLSSPACRKVRDYCS